MTTAERNSEDSAAAPSVGIPLDRQVRAPDPERAAFEAAMAKRGYNMPPALYRDGTYRDTCYSAGWDAWQVARQGGGQWVVCAERKPADLTMCAFVTSDGKLRVGGYSAACGGFREAEADSGTWGAVYWLLLPPVRMPDEWVRSNA